MSIDEAIAHAREEARTFKEAIVPECDYQNMEWIDDSNAHCKRQVEYYEQLAEWLECLNEIAHIFLEHRAFGEYPSSADDMWEETIRVLDKYRIELKDSK